jgi:hypothetical protein
VIVDRKKSRSLLVTAQLTDFVNLLAILKCVAMTKKELKKKKDYKITRVREKPRERAKKNAKFSIVSCMIREPLFLDTLEAVLKSFSYQFSEN